MLPAIELDHQFGSMTHEVRDVIFDRDLAPEARAIQAMIAQLQPEDTLGVGGILSERACVGAQFGRDLPCWLFFVHRDLRCRATPTPTFPRKRERGLTSPNGSTAKIRMATSC